MTKKEWEDDKWATEHANRYHVRTGAYPTNEQAVRAIRKARTQELAPARWYWAHDMFVSRTYRRFAALEIIRRILENNNRDPIKTIYLFYSDMEDMLGLGETSVVWRVAQEMQYAATDILELLKHT